MEISTRISYNHRDLSIIVRSDYRDSNNKQVVAEDKFSPYDEYFALANDPYTGRPKVIGVNDKQFLDHVIRNQEIAIAKLVFGAAKHKIIFDN